MDTLADQVEKQERENLLDIREALFNTGEKGQITEIEKPRVCISQLRGILFDLDPQLFLGGSTLIPEIPAAPRDLYEKVVSRWLSRHPVLAKMEVRISGTGLHGILWFDNPVKFSTEGDRARWEGIMKVVQAALPIDPAQPALTACTRALGSFNSKNDVQVEQLTSGTPVTEAEVLGLYKEMCDLPFRTVFSILAGSEQLSPCPICNKPDSQISASSRTGHCYGGPCRDISLARLYDAVLKPQAKEATSHG